MVSLCPAGGYCRKGFSAFSPIRVEPKTGSCVRQRLAMVDARSEPAELSPGDESIICVRVIDTQGVVAAVTATVREYSAISLDLNDSGEEWMERQGLLECSKE